MTIPVDEEGWIDALPDPVRRDVLEAMVNKRTPVCNCNERQDVISDNTKSTQNSDGEQNEQRAEVARQAGSSTRENASCAGFGKVTSTD